MHLQYPQFKEEIKRDYLTYYLIQQNAEGPSPAEQRRQEKLVITRAGYPDQAPQDKFHGMRVPSSLSRTIEIHGASQGWVKMLFWGVLSICELTHWHMSHFTSVQWEGREAT